MKKLLIALILFFLIISLSAEDKNSQSNTLTSSDWLHLSVPAGCYLTAAQSLESLGCTRETSEYCALTFTLFTCIGKEFYDYHSDGASTMQDLELDILSIITSYYANKAINALLRPQSPRRSQKRK